MANHKYDSFFIDFYRSFVIIDEPKLGDTNISLLLFGGDLAIFSLSQKELQNKINILEEYCYNWGLELNTKKTKIIIFNK